MLKNFNKLLKSVILQNVTQDKDQAYIKFIYNCNEFYNRYLADLANQKGVAVTKQRNNVFLIVGEIKNVIEYFNTLKVDEMFMENPNDFMICAPMYTFNDPEYEMKLKSGQMYAPTSYNGAITTHDVDNEVRRTIYGKWFDFTQMKNKAQKLLKIAPNKFKKYIKAVQKQYNVNDDQVICIQFAVNCQEWKNNIFEDMAQYRTEDQLNQKLGDDNRNIDKDFDYEKRNVKNQKDESHRQTIRKTVKPKTKKTK